MRSGTRTAVLALVVVLAGCGGGGGGIDVVTAEASSATIGDDALSAAGYQQHRVSRDSIRGNRTVSIQGDVELQASYRLNATTSVAEYRARASPPAVVSVYSVPQVQPFDAVNVTLNPVRELSVADLTARVQTAYSSVSDVSHVRNTTVTMLGNETTVSTYAATGTTGNRTVAVAIHVARVRHEGDVVIAVGVHPEGMDAKATVLELVSAVEH